MMTAIDDEITRVRETKLEKKGQTEKEKDDCRGKGEASGSEVYHRNGANMKGGLIMKRDVKVEG